jgi:uncharacterized membrane protein YpjA
VGFWDLATTIRSRWSLLAFVLAADVAGMLFGWFYYYEVGQFDPASQHYTQPYWWPLVSDSPNAVLLFFVAALAYKLTGWRNKWLDVFALTLNAYVGAWTTLLFLSYPERMGTFDWGSANSILFVTHMGMPLQGLLLVPQMRRDRWRLWEVGVVLAALAAFVAVDYWGPHLHPAPFLHPNDGVLHAWSPWLMVAAAGLWLLLQRVGREERPDGGRGVR